VRKSICSLPGETQAVTLWRTQKENLSGVCLVEMVGLFPARSPWASALEAGGYSKENQAAFDRL
jgi:hypothetical protein